MAGAGLDYQSPEATQQTNDTGIMSSILDVTPDNGTMLQLAEAVAKGAERGLPLIMDLRDTNGDPLPDNTEVLLRVERPSDPEDGLAVSQKVRGINPWNSLTISEQRNEENFDSVKIPVKGVVSVRFFDTLHVQVKSSAQIDWTNSELYFYRKAVRTIPFEGGT